MVASSTKLAIAETLSLPPDAVGEGIGALPVAPTLALPGDFPVRPDVEVPGCVDLDDLIQRFWRYVTVDLHTGCWLWNGGNVRGYGVVGLGAPSRRKILATRLSYLLFVGPLGAEQMACHRCDTPPCVNPADLFAGSQLDNMRDAAAKGRLRGRRVAVGERQHLAKLTADLVRGIRIRAAAGEPLRDIATECGLTYQGIKAVVDRRTWRHV